MSDLSRTDLLEKIQAYFAAETAAVSVTLESGETIHRDEVAALLVEARNVGTWQKFGALPVGAVFTWIRGSAKRPASRWEKVSTTRAKNLEDGETVGYAGMSRESVYTA